VHLQSLKKLPALTDDDDKVSSLIQYAPKQGVFRPRLRPRQVSSSESELSVQSIDAKSSGPSKRFKFKFLKRVSKLSEKSKSLSLSDVRLGKKQSSIKKTPKSIKSSESCAEINGDKFKSYLEHADLEPQEGLLTYYAPPRSFFVKDLEHYSERSIDCPAPVIPKRTKKRDLDLKYDHERRILEPLAKVPEQSTTIRKLKKQISNDQPVKRKPLLTRAVHKSLKRIKDQELPNLNDTVKTISSLRDSLRLRKIVQKDQRVKVGKSSFYQEDITEIVKVDVKAEDPPVFDNEEETLNLAEPNETIAELETTTKKESFKDVIDNEVSDDESESHTLVHETLNHNNDDEAAVDEFIVQLQHQNPDIFLDPDSEIDDLLEQPEPSVIKRTTTDFDTDSNTSFYSVASELEQIDGEHHVQFGSCFELNNFGQDNNLSFDKEDLEETRMMSSSSPSSKKTSPLKKLKALFRSNSKDQYDLEHEYDVTVAYVDLPRVSVNPLFSESNEMVHQDHWSSNDEDDETDAPIATR
jgi:hypothetical protein